MIYKLQSAQCELYCCPTSYRIYLSNIAVQLAIECNLSNIDIQLAMYGILCYILLAECKSPEPFLVMCAHWQPYSTLLTHLEDLCSR